MNGWMDVNRETERERRMKGRQIEREKLKKNHSKESPQEKMD